MTTGLRGNALLPRLQRSRTLGRWAGRRVRAPVTPRTHARALRGRRAPHPRPHGDRGPLLAHPGRARASPSDGPPRGGPPPLGAVSREGHPFPQEPAGHRKGSLSRSRGLEMIATQRDGGKDDKEAESSVLYKHPRLELGSLRREARRQVAFRGRQRPFQRAPGASRAPPTMSGGVRRPSSTSRLGKLRHEAARRRPEAPLRGSEAERSAGSTDSHADALVTGFPPPPRWRRRPPPPESHTLPREQRVASGSKDGAERPGAEALPPGLAAAERWERASLRPNMAAAASAPPPPASLRAGGFSSGPSCGREDGPAAPGPFSPLPLLAEEITYPT